MALLEETGDQNHVWIQHGFTRAEPGVGEQEGHRFVRPVEPATTKGSEYQARGPGWYLGAGPLFTGLQPRLCLPLALRPGTSCSAPLPLFPRLCNGPAHLGTMGSCAGEGERHKARA